MKIKPIGCSDQVLFSGAKRNPGQNNAPPAFDPFDLSAIERLGMDKYEDEDIDEDDPELLVRE